MVGPLLFLTFVNDLPDALETLTLLFAVDVKRTQNMNLHISLNAAWDWLWKSGLPIIPVKCNYLTIGCELSLRLSLHTMGLVYPSGYPN